MTDDQAKEMLVLLSEMLLEQRRTNDRLESLERCAESIERRLASMDRRLENIEYDVSSIKRVVYSHEQRLQILEHE